VSEPSVEMEKSPSDPGRQSFT